MDDALICQFLFQNKDILEEVQDSLLNVEMIELGYHGLLIFKVFLVLINQGIPFVNDRSDVIKDRCVGATS